MKNRSLIDDYLLRAENRIAAVEILYERKSWSDVVRESQEIVELTLKALLRLSNIEVPRLHDVSDILLVNKSMLPKKVSASHLERMCEISRSLRRDRELAFYGSEDLTPSEFYKQKDADWAKESAIWVVKTVKSLQEKS